MPTGLRRKEIYSTYSRTVTAEDLQISGMSYINKEGPMISISGTPMLGEPEYELGDEITFFDSKNGTSMNLKVVQIKYTYSGTNKEIKKLMFGKVPLDIAQVFAI